MVLFLFLIILIFVFVAAASSFVLILPEISPGSFFELSAVELLLIQLLILLLLLLRGSKRSSTSIFNIKISTTKRSKNVLGRNFRYNKKPT